jgi:RHS repeat-associated protein
MSSRSKRKNRRNHNVARTSLHHQAKRRGGFSSYVWTLVIAVALIAPIVAVIVFQSAQATAMEPSDNSTTPGAWHSPLSTPTAVPLLGNSNGDDTSPYPYFYPDTEVLVYTGSGESGWRPMPFGAIPWGVEFLFDGRFYDIDSEGRVRVNLSVEANATNLAEADRSFEPYHSRWPEPEDLVRFVDEDNRHLFHNRAEACQAGDRFWFQGVLYRCIADPNDPASLIVKSTYHVLDADGRVLPVEEFAIARGDSLDEVYGSQLAAAGFVGGTVDSSGVLPASFDNGALPSGLGGQQPGGIQSGMSLGGINGLPTDFGFAGQRYDSSTGLIYMGARYYDPYLGRFISPDTIVQQRNDPQSYNRYAYARNNPLLYTDESGHCWGIASGLRNVPGYGVTCNNLDMALTIVQHPNASVGQKAGAAAYIATEGTAHLALAVGGGILAWEGGAAVVSAVGGTEAASTAGTVATAACADGDCTNEVRAVSNVLCADGDCTNEVNAAVRTARSVWEMNPLQRGTEIENMLGRSPELPRNFPVIDRFANGVATSIKSIDFECSELSEYRHFDKQGDRVHQHSCKLARCLLGRL